MNSITVEIEMSYARKSFKVCWEWASTTLCVSSMNISLTENVSECFFLSLKWGPFLPSGICAACSSFPGTWLSWGESSVWIGCSECNSFDEDGSDVRGEIESSRFDSGIVGELDSRFDWKLLFVSDTFEVMVNVKGTLCSVMTGSVTSVDFQAKNKKAIRIVDNKNTRGTSSPKPSIKDILKILEGFLEYTLNTCRK